MADVDNADSGRLQSILLANFSERIASLEDDVARAELESGLWEHNCRNAYRRLDAFNEELTTRGQLLQSTRLHLTEALDERDNLLDLLSRICHENQAIQRVYGARIRSITRVFEATEDIIDLTNE